ncbi:MAG: hypothetical protein LBH88_01230 [Candidatus Methanoplasma sp.]|nr:hypothetical protein [Candidatus Methanoplasma sp.]
MVLSVFKSGDELFNQGVDLVKRKEYAKARKNFERTIEKGGREAQLARVYIDMIDACLDNNNPARFVKLATSLEGMKEGFEFGLTEVDPARVAVECRLLADRVTVARMSGNLEEKGNKLLDIARKYQSQIGNDAIVISGIVGIQVNSGIKEALYVQAWGYESLASAAVMADPKRAAELLQNSLACRKQLGEDGRDVTNLIKAYSESAKCWICGRPSTGRGVHFLTMSSEVTPFMRKADEDSVLKSAPSDFGSVYVCKACYTSVSRRADEISKVYYDRAIQEMRAMEARLQAEIRSVTIMARR